ncbi:hypothetical protein NW752_001207 [Fusarium irregulare]|uniref:GRF-like zinc ribbon domain-containing protein n=1 Tax=Fusarium irregulare TaxID=2494466 RepID=A0A9W8PG87_9HYPO|nr:hypothetical protein NW766_010784 [Fusarium irregulare]KAJ4026268.1 hypothetical protein NW752_001207 [Fusarium irregulare]
MTAQFPLTYPPTCPQCDQLATRARVDAGKRSNTANRPYYYCQSGHKRQFVTWDDMEGISSHNPRCRCGYHSRRNQGNGPIPSEWFACASKTCSFSQNIDTDDEPVYTRSPQRSQGSTMSSTVAASSYRDHDKRRSPSVEDVRLHEIIQDMSIKVERMESTIASQRSAAQSSVNIDCSVHGSGRSSFFRRRRCICAF